MRWPGWRNNRERQSSDMDQQSDREALLSQISSLIPRKGLDDSVVAIYFGIFTKVERGSASPMLYVIGATEYDPSDDDWACEDDDYWMPKGRYLKLPVLKSMDPAD